MNRFLALIVCFVLCSPASAVDFTYLGAFKVPDATKAPWDENSLEYSEGRIAYNPAKNSIYISGHDWYQRVSEISIPALKTGALNTLNTAAWIQEPVNIAGRIPQYTLEDTVKIGGMTVDEQGRLIVAFYEFYDGDADAVRSHIVVTTPANLKTSQITGLCQVGTMGGGFVGGYMCRVPDEWRAQIGKPFLTGMAGIAVTGRTSNGPAAFGFDPAQLSQTSVTDVVPLVYYPLTNPLRKEDTQNDYFNTSTQIRGVTIHGDEVCFWGTHGTGPWSYTQGGSTDPYRPNDNVHAPPYRYQRWIYKMADLLAVKAGTKKAWEIQPRVEAYTMPSYGDSSKYAGGVSFDPSTNRVFVAQKYGDTAKPVIHVFQANGSVVVPPDTTPPVISNVRVVEVTETSAKVAWSTDEASDTRVEYGTTNSFGNLKVVDETVTEHSYTINGLLEGTQYSYRVKSWDRAPIRNSATSPTFTFTTVAHVDPTEELQQRILELEAEVAALETENDTLRANVASLSDQVHGMMLQIDSLAAEVIAKDAQLLNLQQLLDAANAKVEELLNTLSQIHQLSTP